MSEQENIEVHWEEMLIARAEAAERERDVWFDRAVTLDARRLGLERERDEALAELRLARTEVNYHSHDAKHQRQRAETACAQVATLSAALDTAGASIAFLRSCLFSGEDLDSDDIKHLDDVLSGMRDALGATDAV